MLSVIVLSANPLTYPKVQKVAVDKGSSQQAPVLSSCNLEPSLLHGE